MTFPKASCTRSATIPRPTSANRSAKSSRPCATRCILVALVVLVFLQGWRPSIIPLIAVPVAIVGTFAAMAVVGFSLNNLTLFGLVLAIGIVVDDAIVVVEAVEYHIEHGLKPRDAAPSSDGRSGRPDHRRRSGADRAVFIPCAVYLGHRWAVLPAVRTDDRRSRP